MIPQLSRLTVSMMLCIFTAVHAQELKPKSVASPEVASLGKFGEIPIGNYTGTPDINIPLYTLDADGVQIPITLRYHASGIQVEQEATWVGLGWDLSVGGSLTQIINGLSDKESEQYFSLPTYNRFVEMANGLTTVPFSELKTTRFCHNDVECPNGSMLLQDLNQLKEHSWASPDRYTFSLPTGTGEFFIDPVSKEIVQSGNLNNRFFIRRTITPQGYITKTTWTIEDTKGNLYYFDEADRETTFTEFSGANDFSGVTYRLTYIKTATGELVKFKYANAGYTTGSYTESKGHTFGDGGGDSHNNFSFDTGFAVKYVSEIETSNEKIVFELSQTGAERLDLPGSKRINAIHIWDKHQNKKIKTVRFTYSFFASNQTFYGKNSTVTDKLTKRLRLDAVTQVGYKPNGDPEDGATHNFEYESTLLPRKDSYARDYWGYFNGSNNTSFLPDLEPEILSGVFPLYEYQQNYTTPPIYAEEVTDWFRANGSANKGASSYYVKAGMLKKIIYPTRGYTTFEYESHDFTNYRTFSADEHLNVDGQLYKTIVAIDNNKTPTETLKPRTEELLPKNGVLTLRDFAAGFVRIDQTIPLSLIGDCWVKIFRVGSSSPIYEWNPNFEPDGTLKIYSNFPGFVPTATMEPITITINGSLDDRYYVEAYMPTLPVNPNQSDESGIPRAYATAVFKVSNDLGEIVSQKSIGGGVRIKTMTHVDGLTGTSERTQYRYLQSDGLTSSGKLMSPVKNHHFTPYRYGSIGQTLNVVQLASFSYTPLATDAQGSVVGYDRVEVVTEGIGRANGKTVYQYHNKPSAIFGTSFGSFTKPIPNVPFYDNGLAKSVHVYNSDDELVHETVTTYQSLTNDVFYNILALDLEWGALYQNSNCNCDSYIWPDKWLAVFVPIKTQWYVPTSSTETAHEGNSTLSTTTAYSYNSFGQVTATTLTSSKNESKVLRSTYPADITSNDPIIVAMKGRKLYELPLENSEWVDQREVSRTIYGYETYSNGSIMLDNVKKSLNGGPLVADVTDIQYDERENILEYKKDGIVTSYLWGYNSAYPIAQTENAAYVDNNYTNTESTVVVDVLKTAGPEQPPYTLQFSVNRSGNVTFNIGMYSAPGADEAMTIHCTLSGTNATGPFYEQSFELCLTTGGSQEPVCPTRDGVPVTLNNLSPGQYILTAVMSYEHNLAVNRGRRITITYPDVVATSAGAEFYFENFEENGTPGVAHTGKRYGTENALSWTPPNARSYVISYWYRENGEWKFSGRQAYTGTSYTLTGGDAYDDVRIHPKDALMTNYCFEPLVGMSAEIDPSGITTYYEYDAQGRLKLVRDQKGNILKSFKYHYKQ